MGFIKAIIKLIPLLTKLAEGIDSMIQKHKQRKRHEQIDDAFEKDDPRDAAADLNKFFD